MHSTIEQATKSFQNWFTTINMNNNLNHPGQNSVEDRHLYDAD